MDRAMGRFHRLHQHLQCIGDTKLRHVIVRIERLKFLVYANRSSEGSGFPASLCTR